MKTLAANELVTVETFQNEIEAQIAQGRLKSEGIKSFIFKDDIGGTTPGMQFALGVDLRVRQIDFARASKALESFQSSRKETNKSIPGENRAAIYSVFAWLLCFGSFGVLTWGALLGRATIVVSFAVLVIGIIFGLRSRKIKKQIVNT